ncbi:Protein CBR-FAR-4 [Caenorhabditis briggsae]|nr:Protein CBR-FAR-4 [Caenorhabditis briggsae]ULT89835.1 hypothetical protein L3Y34_008323 [Caenorhabditis briggsae]CAP29118.2 Protein CBR-FAR-4 [Caenorhabditis briggsae]
MINDLKQINPVLGSRVERKMIELKKKVAGLSDESKRFVDSLKAAGREVYAQRLKGQQMDRFQLRQIGMGVAQHYRFLSPYAQQELQSTFPQIFEFMQQARAQMLQRFLGGGGMAGMAGMGGMDEMGK